MNYRDLMKWRNHIYLDELTEPEENSLRILINICSNIDSPFEVEKDSSVQLDFESYISYSIINESFTETDKYEISEGERFRIFTKSRYLDFVKISTIAEDIFPDDPFTHYCIPCLNHIIDIISFKEPKIIELKRS